MIVNDHIYSCVDLKVTPASFKLLYGFAPPGHQAKDAES